MDWSSIEAQLAHPENDKRIQALATLAQLLKQADFLPNPDHLAVTLRPCVRANNAHVSAAALACLPSLFPLVILPDPSAPSSSSSASAASSLRHVLSLLLPLDRLADAKPAVRQLAGQALVSAAQTSLRLGIDAGAKSKDGGPWILIESGVLEYGFESKNAKAREQALHFLAAIRCPAQDSTVTLPPLRPFTPQLLPLLSDSDASVRALALQTTIAVFSHPSVTPAAKADLKKAMLKLDVARKVQDQVLGAVLGGGAGAPTFARSPSQASLSSVDGTSDSLSRTAASTRSSTLPAAIPEAPARRLTRSQAASQQGGANGASNGASVAQTPASLATLPAAAFPSDPSAVHAPAGSGDISPVYIASESDLRAEFAQMHAAFEGKETEHNWVERDRHVATIRGMLLGGAAKSELKTPFVQCVKEVQDGIIRTSASLRTTLAISALALISELASSLTPSLLDVVLEPFLAHVLSMAGQTKKIVATASQATATALLTHGTYRLRSVQLVTALSAEKTPQARLFGSQHVLTLLRVHGAHLALASPSSPGADELEQAVAKALADSNAQVRERAREAYRQVVRLGWSDRAERLRAALDTTAKKLLDKAKPVADAAREGVAEEPARGSGASAPTSVRRVSAATAAAQTGANFAAGREDGAKKPSIREIMLAKRREALAAAKEQNGASHDGLLDEVVVSTPRRRSTGNGVASPFSSISATPQETPTRQPVPALAHSPLAPPDTSNATDGLLASAGPRTPIRAPLSPSPPRSLVPDRIVDDALREQALQAEQAAERLLELAEDEAEHASAIPSAPASASTPVGQRVAAPHVLSTPAPNPILRRVGAGSSSSVFADSPDARDPHGAATRGSWWLKRAEALSASASTSTGVDATREPDSEARRNEIEDLIARMARAEVDEKDLRQVARLARERPVRDSDEVTENDSYGATGENGAFWMGEGRFERVYEGLRAFLLRSGAEVQQSGTTRDYALLALKDLVENQSSCLAGVEATMFDLLFRLREDPSRTSIAATEAISSSFIAQLEPLYGLGALVPALEAYLSSTGSGPASPVSYALGLGLRQMGTFFELLPREVLEDVLPRSAALLKRALNDSNAPDLRRAALLTLVSAHSTLQDAQRLDELVGGLESDQKSLLAYYAAKRGL